MSWLALTYSWIDNIFYDVTKGTRDWYKWSFGILFTAVIVAAGCLFMLVFIPTFYIIAVIEKVVLLVFNSTVIRWLFSKIKALIYVGAK